MIIAVLRLGLFMFVAMLVVYFVLSIWSRATRRKKLGAEWDEEIKTGDRTTFIRQGLAEYDGSLRRKLIFGVFIVPYLVVGVLIYVVNFQ